MTAETIINFLTTWVPVLFSVVGAASAAAAATPKTGESPTWAVFRAVLNVIALNVNNAKNAPSPYQESQK